MDLGTVTVLLVEHDVRYASVLENYLLKRGCEICLAGSKQEALEFLERRHFDLVLSEFLLSDGTAYGLMPRLLGSATTMFFSNAVEDGCWWMNAIFEGQDRSLDPGMRPAQFKILLEKILLNSYRSKSQNQECPVQSATFEVQASTKKRRSIMRRANVDPVVWSPTQLRPGVVASFRRWNAVIIAVLVFLVLGVFVAAIGPRLEARATAASKVPLKIDKDPVLVSLADFSTNKSSALQGVVVEPLTLAIAHQLGVAPSLTGVEVTSVGPSRAAADLQSGDIIREINHKLVHNTNEYHRAVAGLGNQPALLLITRGGNAHFIVLEPQPPK